MESNGASASRRRHELFARLCLAYAPVLAVLFLYYLSALLVLGEVKAQVSFDIVQIFFRAKMMIWLLLSVCFVNAYVILIFNPTKERLYRRLQRWFRQTPFLEIVFVRILPVVLMIGVLQAVYLAFKRSIPGLEPFSWDPLLASLDHLLFLGTDPWKLTHWLLPWANATRTMAIAYGIWFYLMYACLVSAAAMRLDSRRRMAFLLGFLLIWTVAGSFLATIFSSAGPCYMERLFGDAMYAPLMDILTAQNHVVEFGALTVQEDLWQGYTDPSHPAMGISAFPSMHLCICALMTRFGFSFSRVLGWMLATFSVVIYVASVHLGWHYAVDGIAGFALGCAAWAVARRFADWWFENAPSWRNTGEAEAR